MTGSERLAVQRIEEAVRLIDPVFLGSPQYECEPLSDALGVRLVLKVETCNPIRSFKGRGADLFLARDADDAPLVCASAGNFGQAMAYACRSRALRLTVFAAESANPLKLARMRELGADVRLGGSDFDAAKSGARRYADERGLRFVEDGREPAISEGAGTIALELLAAEPGLDVVFVPLGNGALAAGIATVLRARHPSVRVVAVAARGAPAMVDSLRVGHVMETPRVETMADGIAVRVPVPEALLDLAGQLDDTRLVDDADLVRAMRLVHRHAGIVVEPAGVAGVAALLADAHEWRGARVATVLCGGNLTPEQVSAWILPGPVAEREAGPADWPHGA
ncbi:MAG: pyridoxal-phosphate dependent enzyme [bacterium]|nr:pyridoxal-phosphate dependent enzyme [bacterium]